MNALDLPGPRGRLLNTWRFLRDPYATTLAWRDAYGDPFLARTELRPERFLDTTFASTDYLPFGGGHRRCIGAAFADMELRIVASTLLAGFQLTLLEPASALPIRRNLTVAPKGGVPVRIGLRKRSSVATAATSALSPPAALG